MHIYFPEFAYAENVEQQHAVIRRDGAAAFRNDRGMRHLRFIAYVLYVIDHIVSVFLQRIVDTRFKIGLRSVVIDPEAAADIHELQAGSGALQLDVDANRFAHRPLHLADIRNLAAQVEMQKLHAVGHAEIAQESREREPLR